MTPAEPDIATTILSTESTAMERWSRGDPDGFLEISAPDDSVASTRWNTTEVYQRTTAGWKIVHTHWAFNQPKLAP